MTKVININQRGTLTLPKEMRPRLGVSAEGQVVAEETDDGVLLRAGVTFPIESYSEKRLEEFRRNNEEALPVIVSRKNEELAATARSGFAGIDAKTNTLVNGSMRSSVRR